MQNANSKHPRVIPDSIQDPFTQGTWNADQVRNDN